MISVATHADPAQESGARLRALRARLSKVARNYGTARLNLLRVINTPNRDHNKLLRKSEEETRAFTAFKTAIRNNLRHLMEDPECNWTPEFKQTVLRLVDEGKTVFNSDTVNPAGRSIRLYIKTRRGTVFLAAFGYHSEKGIGVDFEGMNALDSVQRTFGKKPKRVKGTPRKTHR